VWPARYWLSICGHQGSEVCVPGTASLGDLGKHLGDVDEAEEVALVEDCLEVLHGVLHRREVHHLQRDAAPGPLGHQACGGGGPGGGRSTAGRFGKGGLLSPEWGPFLVRRTVKTMADRKGGEERRGPMQREGHRPAGGLTTGGSQRGERA